MAMSSRKLGLFGHSRFSYLKVIIFMSPTILLLYFTLFSNRIVLSPALREDIPRTAAAPENVVQTDVRPDAPPVNVAPLAAQPAVSAADANANAQGDQQPAQPPPPTLDSEMKPPADAAVPPAPEKAAAAAEGGMPSTGVSGQNLAPAAPTETKERFCDGASLENPCVFDIGLNTGQDTALYLGHAKTRVVAVEANPMLIENSKTRFAKALQKNRLHLVGMGLTDKKPVPGAANPTITFWVNSANDKFSSFVEKLGCRTANGKRVPAGDHSNCRPMEIPTRTCHDLVLQYGRPTYMKIDIEGMDRACFRSLEALPKDQRPQYLSVENVFPWDIEELVVLGYTKFKVVNQAVLEAAAKSEETKGVSGPWGDDAVDEFVGRKWHTEAEVKARLPLPKEITFKDGVTIKAWYDLHAAM